MTKQYSWEKQTERPTDVHIIWQERKVDVDNETQSWPKGFDIHRWF